MSFFGINVFDFGAKGDGVTDDTKAILSAPEGNMCIGLFSVLHFSISNLEFAVPLNVDKMYPTQSAVNLQNVGSVNFECGTWLTPAISQLRYGVYDKENRLHGRSLGINRGENKNFLPIAVAN